MKWLDGEDISSALIDAGFKLRDEDCWATKFEAVATILDKKLKYDIKGQMEEFIREL